MEGDEDRRVDVTATLANLKQRQHGAKIELPVETLVSMRAAYNPRRISPEAMDKLRASLREFGPAEPVVVNLRTGNLVGGHQRVEAARLEGWETLPVTVVDLPLAREMALNVALNNPGLQGEFVDEDLAAVFRMIAAEGEQAGLTGFTEAEMAAIERLGLADSASGEWVGMPEFTERSKESFKRIVCHFVDQAAVDAFAKAVGKEVTETTRYLWFPEQVIERFADKVYATPAPQEPEA